MLAKIIQKAIFEIERINSMDKFDRTVFKAMTAEEANKEMQNHQHLSMKERLQLTMYLNSIAFNFPINNPPKLDRTVFEARARK